MRYKLVAIAVGTAALLGGLVAAAQRPQRVTVEVFKTASCGCCANWVQHLEQNGFSTRVTNLDDLTDVKARHQVPRHVQSCHTAIVDGYVIEGHVPARDVRRLLEARPSVAGIAVPGMPIGSPGMEVGARVQAYDVVTFDKQGRTQVFASYEARSE